MIDFMKLLELVQIDGFTCEISSDANSIKFTWRGWSEEVDQVIGYTTVISKIVLSHAVAPEDVIICAVTAARKGLEKMR